jgi:hypothetical protein
MPTAFKLGNNQPFVSLAAQPHFGLVSDFFAIPSRLWRANP